MKPFFKILPLIVTLFYAEYPCAQTIIHLTGINQNLVTPVRIAIDNADTVYVTDATQKKIIQYDASGNFIKTISAGVSPLSLAVDANNRLFTGDAETGNIYRINSNGTATLLYSGTKFPSSMECIADSIYIVDSKLKEVIVIDLSGNFIRSFGNGIFTYPTGIAYNPVSNKILVAEHGGIGPGFNPVIKIRMFDFSGNVTDSFGSYGNGNGELYRVQGIDVDRCGNIYIPDPSQGSVNIYNDTGAYMTRFGAYGNASGQLNIPLDVAINSNDNIWVTSMNTSAVEIYKINYITSNISSGIQTICSGQTADITIDFTGTGPWTFTYTRDGSNPVTVSNVTGNPYTLTVSEAGTYEVSGLFGANCAGGSMTGNAVITVNPLPSVDAGNDQSVCQGASVTLSASGAISYAWDNSVTDGSPFTPLSTTTYSVTGTDNNGCTNSDNVLVTVHNLPSVSAGSDQAVCEGTAIILWGYGAITYVWDNGISDGVPFTPDSTKIYTVTGTDIYGCSNTDAVTVTVNVIPSVNAGNDQSVCEGNNVTLSGSGAVSYVWDNGITDGVPFTPANTNTYSVTGTDINGCSNSDAVTVTINSLPVVNAGSDQSVCEGTAVTLSGNGAVSYIWDNGITDGVPFLPAATAVYSVTGTDANGCTGTDAVTVIVSPEPVPGFAYSSNGYEITFQNTSLNANSYKWDFGDGDSSNLQNPVHLYQSAGNYIVILTASNPDCGNVIYSDTVTILIIGVPVINFENNFIVYPNPSCGQITIEINSSSQPALNLEITDMIGRIIFAGIFETQKTTVKKIDLSGYPAGVYTIKLFSDNLTTKAKLILNK